MNLQDITTIISDREIAIRATNFAEFSQQAMCRRLLEKLSPRNFRRGMGTAGMLSLLDSDEALALHFLLREQNAGKQFLPVLQKIAGGEK